MWRGSRLNLTAEATCTRASTSARILILTGEKVPQLPQHSDSATRTGGELSLVVRVDDCGVVRASTWPEEEDLWPDEVKASSAAAAPSACSACSASPPSYSPQLFCGLHFYLFVIFFALVLPSLPPGLLSCQGLFLVH